VSSHLSILVVDDEPTIRMSLQTILRREGYRVVIAETGAEAITALRDQDFAVAVIDLVLPDLDGLAVLETARRLQPECRCVVLTAYGVQEKARRVARHGAFDYLVKPTPVQEILGRVKHAAADYARGNG
jgi:DNA-binding NtrC family response regulator